MSYADLYKHRASRFNDNARSKNGSWAIKTIVVGTDIIAVAEAATDGTDGWWQVSHDRHNRERAVQIGKAQGAFENTT
eukprot:scaffold41787_cov54-Cyclotella_meneghiniana.AAC.4